MHNDQLSIYLNLIVINFESVSYAKDIHFIYFDFKSYLKRQIICTYFDEKKI